MDYFLFLQGFGLFLGGVFILFLGKIPSLQRLVLPTSLFCFFYTVLCGLQISAGLREDGDLLEGVAALYGFLAVLMLFAAGTLSLQRTWRSARFFLWWLLPLAIFLLGSLTLRGVPTQNLLVWSFGLPGALLLGVGVRLAARQFSGPLQRRLIFLAYGFAAFALYFLLTAGQLTAYGLTPNGEFPLLALVGAGQAFFLLITLWQTYEFTHHPEILEASAARPFSIRNVILPLFLLACVLGWVFTQWLGAQQEEALLRALLLRTALIEDALKPESLEQLPANLNEPGHPAQQEVRHTLQRFNEHVAGTLEVFLITRDTPDGIWYFLSDSTGEDEEGYLLPGRPFQRLHPGLDWAAILAGEAWVSPAILSEKGLTRELLTRLRGVGGSRPIVLGVRLEEQEIQLEVARERLIGIVVTLCFLGLLSGAYATHRVNETAGRAIEATRHHLLLALDSAGLCTWEYHPESGLFSLQYPLSRFSPQLPPGDLPHLEDFFALLPENEQRLAREKIEDLQEGRTADFALELPIPLAGSSEVHWLWWKGGVSQRDLAGKPRLLSGTLQSIQERVTVREALEKSRESLRQVVSTVSEVIFETDADGCWTFLNPAWTELSGLAVRDSLGQSINRFLGLDRNQALRRKIASFFHGSGPERLHETLPVRRVDDTELWVEITANRLLRPDGSTRGMVGTLRDVTAQRRNQRILESIVLINSGLISARLEREGWQYSLRLLGEAANLRDAWVASWIEGDFFPQAHWSEEKTADRELPTRLPEGFREWRSEIEKGKEFICRPTELPPTLREFFTARQTASVLALPIFCGVDFWGMLCFETGRESRPWGREELALLRSAAAAFGLCLARQRGDDALQEATDNARRAAEAAEAANRAKSAFLATMSHEIRTPLNAVIGMASLLQESHLTPQQQEYAGTVVGASKSLLDLINDILDYSKIEAGRIDLHLEEVNLAELCIEGLELLAPTARQKGIHLAYDIPPGFPASWKLDRMRVRQILLNLLSNGVKFTARGEVSLSLRSTATCPGRQRLEIRVSDTGIGIPAQTLPKLFTPFLQADSSITRKYGGTGLGLAITKRLLEAMGGGIEVESTSGEGTRFLISLEAEVPDASPWFHPGPIQRSASQAKILLGISFASSRHLINSYLGVLGYQVRTVENFPALAKQVEDAPEGAVVFFDRDFLPARGQQELPRLVQVAAEKNLRLLLFADRPQDLAPGLRAALTGCLPRLFRIPALLSLLQEPATHALPTTPDPTSSTAVGVPSGTSSGLSGVRVLVAEDNPNNQKVLRLMLRKLGCHLQMVENGLQAIQAARTNRFDLIILDLQMPIMDGLTAVTKLKEYYTSSSSPRPVIMALTANAFEEDRTACLAAGFDRYLAKPVSASQLRQAIEECLATSTTS